MARTPSSRHSLSARKLREAYPDFSRSVRATCVKTIVLTGGCALAPQALPIDASLSVRHSWINYDPVEPDSFGTDQLGIEVTDDSLESYTTGDLMFSLRIRNTKARIKFGVLCTSYELKNPNNGIQGCKPVIGFVSSAPRFHRSSVNVSLIDPKR